MADDPGHKAMLYFLEILMHSNAPLTISQLAGRFGSRNFTAEMRQSAGGNETGLKKFLQKYPSLFSVNGNLISLNDGTANLGRNFRESSPASTSSGPSAPEVSTETEAVQFFRAKLLKRGEKWMPIKSLAGHLSQAPLEIRECVGPQNEFREWLLRHPLIYELKGDNACLKDNITYSAVNPNSEPLEDMNFNNRYSANLSYLEKDMFPSQLTPKLKRRPRSLEMFEPNSPLMSPRSPMKQLPTPSPRSGPTTMTANEYKAVMFIKGIIEKKGDMKLGSLVNHFGQAPESLRNTVGWSKQELDHFLVDHSNIFIIGENEMVSVIKSARLNVIITGSRPPASPKPTVTNRKGRIYHVAKLWGIIDLGKHEHVFIDRSIFGKHVDDLHKILCVGEMACFDAIPAAKGSRARWRATKIWKEHESIEELIERVATRLQLPIDGIPYKEPPSPIANIDEEMRGIIPELNDANINIPVTPVSVGGIKYAFTDAAPSGTGVVPVWNFKHTELDSMKDVDDLDLSDDSDNQTLSMVAERYYMNRSVLGDSPRDDKTSKEEKKAKVTNGISEDISSAKKGMVDAGCQTIVTGEVLATQLFHEEM
ncbi:uncharacterized protein LOC110457286 [Mizuhopecten yessoensis]|uniref:Egal-1 winged helix domain-containing protein n=1 Tax=Mizuhopecten yessoensis TaxID=6573 RepID=A0A210Q935_MIZYE|nr:uncharacterized protein LOC110457286 [Mizuhopecten yessoensis]OWF45253.1 hypothetical protein KP79_PYT11276 [Mizuhopecten yessoensis]